MHSISIIIPAYNEENTISLVLERIKQLSLENVSIIETIVVNDASQDGTDGAIKKFITDNTNMPIQYYTHEKNKGKGAALHTGIKHAKNDYIVVQDADLEYDPNEIDLLMKPIIYDNADVVYGSRFIGGKPHRILFFWHSIGNKMLTFFSNMSTNLNLTDMETCYKLIKKEILQSLELKEKRFGFEPEVTAKLSRIKEIKIYEVGISYYGRTYAEGKKINWKDGFRALYCITKYGFLKR